jgi:protein-arginine kinase activator protein McsA
VEKIRKLREKIQKAVAVENYEVAAELKKMIQEFENPKGNYEI